MYFPGPDARISVEADMSHPGMKPVVASVRSLPTRGDYRADFRFTMRGDWVLTVRAQLANGRSIEKQIPVTVAAP